MKLLIDYREKSIIDLLDIGVEKNKTVKWNNIEINVEICNLPVADFAFSNSDNENLLLVERKTLNDLESSIIDGRFRQQKARLIESIGNPNNILYIIENTGKIKNYDIINGSILNMLYKHNFKLLFSKNHDNTLTFLSIIYKKIKNGEILNSIVSGNNDSTNTEIIQLSPLKLLSKSDKIKQKLFQCMLTIIPGVSISMSDKITDIYPTLISLINAYENIDEKAREKLLANIDIGNRKLGPVLSKKIWKTLYFNTID